MIRKLFCLSLSILLLGMTAAPAWAQRRTTTSPRVTARCAPSGGARCAIHRSAIVVDTHNDILSMMTDDNYDLGVSSVGKYHTDLARMKQGGLTAEFFSVYVDRQVCDRRRFGAARARHDRLRLSRG